MKIYVLTYEQVRQLEALNKPNLCFCASGHEKYDYVVGEHDLDLPVFADHKALLDSFNIELVEDDTVSDMFMQ